MAITGVTRVFYVLADPIDQVRAPEAFNLIFRAHGIDAVLVPLQARAQALEATVHALLQAPNTGGILLSIPHKHAALDLVERSSGEAMRAQAVNAIRLGADGKLEGALFDGIGFVKASERADLRYRGQSALLIGAGGAAAAIASALADAGLARLAIYDPAPDKAAQLATRLRAVSGMAAQEVGSNDPRGYALVINASPLGLKQEDALPLDVARLDTGAGVFDVLMKNQPTPLVRAARARGLQVEPGFEMLIQQIPLYLEFFGYHKAAVAVAADADAIRELIYPANWNTSDQDTSDQAAGYMLPA